MSNVKLIIGFLFLWAVFDLAFIFIGWLVSNEYKTIASFVYTLIIVLMVIRSRKKSLEDDWLS